MGLGIKTDIEFHGSTEGVLNPEEFDKKGNRLEKNPVTAHSTEAELGAAVQAAMVDLEDPDIVGGTK